MRPISNKFPFPCKTSRCLSDRIEEKGKCAELDRFHLRGRRQVDAAHNAVMVKASQVSPICPPFTLAPMHSNNKAPPLSATVFSSMSKPSSLLLHIPNSGEFIVIEQQHHHHQHHLTCVSSAGLHFSSRILVRKSS